MVRKIFPMLLSIWGWICLSVAFYYTALYFVGYSDPYRNEFWEGVYYAWMFGSISWILLPIITLVALRKLSLRFRISINLPVGLALIYLCSYLIYLIVKT